jgi:integrase
MYYKLKTDRKGQPKYVFVYYFEGGQVKQVPRAATKELDGQSDENIRYWMRWYASEKGYAHGERSAPQSHPKLERLAEDFAIWLSKEEGNAEKTVQGYLRDLREYVFPYFLSCNPVLGHDPNSWAQYSSKMRSAFEADGMSKNSIRTCNTALRRFWTYLHEERLILQGLDLYIRNPKGFHNQTPLKVTLDPDAVLAFGRDVTKEPLARFMALVGYFFSLRPQELFAIERKYFKAGSSDSGYECVKSLRKFGFNPKLLYYVEMQESDNGVKGDPKKSATGWVACFNSEAERLIVELLKDMPSFGASLPARNHIYYPYWKKKGLSGFTLKDLRRASLYWLGHHTDLPPLVIQKHARHKDFTSTQKYLRRPDEGFDGPAGDDLDLDA